MTTVKVCGAVSVEDLVAIADGGADLVGLWHGVPGGHAELSRNRLAALVAAARARDLRPVLVTLLRDPGQLTEIIDSTAVPVVQLHGYQPPAVVRAVKTRTRAIVVKVLHVGPDGCPELALIDAYGRAGTDLFLVDATGADGRLGSTGHRVAADRALELADRIAVPFLLAGGIGGTVGGAGRVSRHPMFHGVDVDTGARDSTGRLDRDRIAAVVRTWRTAPPAVVAG